MSSGMEPGSAGPMVARAVRTLAVDALARDVAARLAENGVASILIKGAALAWLYDQETLRAYGDIDLLVEFGQVSAAEGVLASLGFATGPGHAPAETPHARPWRRAADGAVVDLHWTISGSCLSPQLTWSVLGEHTEPLSLGGGEVRTLDRTAAALLVVLHASQHGEGKPLFDLGRALGRVSLEEWRAVAALADRLRADFGLADGLRLLPEGERVAEALDLPPRELFEASASRRAGLVLGFERLARTRGVRRRAWLLVSEAFPDVDFMRWRFPVARHGRLGLVIAYAWRLGWLGWRLGPSLLAWRRTARRG